MLPEVQAFITALDEAESACTKVIEKARELPRDTDEQYNAWWNVRQDAKRAQRDAINTAWTRLTESEDKLVAYIATEYGVRGDYRGECVTVLKALPATPKELQTLAESHSWCDSWDTAFDIAADRGVIPGSEHHRSEARAKLRSFLSNYGMYVEQRRKVIELAEAMAAEAVGKALEAHGITGTDGVTEPAVVEA